MLKAAVGGCALVVAVPLLLIVLVAAVPRHESATNAWLAGAPTAYAKHDIPAAYLRWYMDAARICPGLSWAVLAAVGKTESDHGRGPGPGIRSGQNSAGAMGPMQFLAGTWKAYGADANHDGVRNVYDPADAIYGAARYLCASGAKRGTPHSIRKALYAYNHAWWYVELVLKTAARYAAPAVSGVAAKIVAYARAQLGKPYVWGAEGPDAFDCSGLTMMAYRSAGITIPRVTYDQWRTGTRVPRGQEQPGDLVFFRPGSQGPGHVGIIIDRKTMINARCTACRPGVWTGTWHRRDLVGVTRPQAQSAR